MLIGGDLLQWVHMSWCSDPRPRGPGSISLGDLSVCAFFFFFFPFSSFWPSHMACGIYFPGRGSNPHSLHWKCRIMITEMPGKSVCVLLKAGASIVRPGQWAPGASESANHTELECSQRCSLLALLLPGTLSSIMAPPAGKHAAWSN